MVNKKLKGVNEKSVLFVVFILLAILTIGSLFVVKPTFTGFVTAPDGESCDGEWINTSDWGTCTEGVQTKTWVNITASNCTSPIVENQTCDSSEPIITLVGNAEVTIEVGTSYVDEGATATDVVDGDLTSSIVVGGDSVDTSVIGVYVITYDVADSAGNNATQVTRTINVVAVCVPVCDNLECGDDGCGGSCGSCESGYTCDTSGVCQGDSTSSDSSTSSGDTSSEETNSGITANVVESSCVSDWQCDDWTKCAGGTQTRKCVDANNCVIPTDNPAISLPCEGSPTPTEAPGTLETPEAQETCADGIENQDEKGIDCGGVCDQKCSFFTIMGNAVNVPLNSSRQFVKDNKTISFSILGVFALMVSWILIAKFVLKKKNVFFFLEKIKK